MSDENFIDLPPTFAAEDERRRLSRVASRAVVRLAEQWETTNAEAAALLGVSRSTWVRMKAASWNGVLSQDQLTRASALIGIFKGLHQLFADSMADRWPTLPNRARVFDRKSPIQAMIEGGIPQMLATRRHVEAICEGP